MGRRIADDQLDDRFRRPHTFCRSWIMKWETPEAVDLRYGMEITMYISNR